MPVSRFLAWFVVVNATDHDVCRDHRATAARPHNGYDCLDAHHPRLSGVATCDGGTQLGQRLMLGFALSLLCLRLVSVVLGGGYGIFSLIMSFYVPSVGADAFVLLSTATAIFFLCRSG